MRVHITGVWLVGMLLTVSAGCGSYEPVRQGPAQRYAGEQAPTFRASELLAAEVIRGPNYTIDEEVPVVDYGYYFKIRSEYGVIPAHGRDMLELRLREMRSIDRAYRLSKDDHFIDGAIGSFHKTGRGLEELLTDPGGALLRAPKGFDRMVRQELDPADRRAGSEARRKLAAQLQCDPETQNPVLKKLLDEMALQQDLGGFLTGTAVDTVLPGMGLLSTTAEIKQLVQSKPPHEINEMIERELKSMGIGEYLCEKLCRDVNYTTTQRLLFMQHVRALRAVKNLAVLLEGAVEVQTEAEGLSAIHEVQLLAELHRRTPIRELLNLGLIGGVLSDDRTVVVGALDYVTNTQEVLDAVAGYRRPQPQSPTILLITGRASAAAKKTFEDRGIQVVENGQQNW